MALGTLVTVGSPREFVRHAASVLIEAARLLFRHWPVLLSLALAGMAFRGAALWAAVEVSDHIARRSVHRRRPRCPDGELAWQVDEYAGTLDRD